MVLAVAQAERRICNGSRRLDGAGPLHRLSGQGRRPFARAFAAAHSPTKSPRPKVSPRSIAPSFVRANRSRCRCSIEGKARGVAVATFDPATQIGQSWREASRLLSIMAFALAGLCLAVYAALARALRPTRVIRAGLKQLAANDLSARLPRFDLAELSAISDVFNTLAQKLQATLAERNALTRKLIAVQDEERRHLARELHDEFGQSLTAIAAQAAAAAHTAERECPPLLEECRGISRTTAGMMETLRGALVRLRPPDVEELGLTLSLESLVASWNGFEKGRTRFDIAVIGKVDDLPPSVCASLYRIAQEAITNAAKHAQARRVQLRLEAGRGRHRAERRGRRRGDRRQSRAKSRHGTARHAGAGRFARRNAAFRAAAPAAAEAGALRSASPWPVVVAGAGKTFSGPCAGRLHRAQDRARGPSPCGVACLSLSRVPIVRPDAPNASSIWHV